MNMGELLKHAQQFQQKLTEIQQELGKKSVTGIAGGGMVTVTFNGRSELTGITIDKEVVNPDDVQMLQDLVASAVNDGLIKSKELSKAEMGRLTGGLNIPGLI
jgi:DNA-binding YbaB/EbfC family protein